MKLLIQPKEHYLPFGNENICQWISLEFFSSEALTILSVHQAKIIKPTATKYILQLADMKLHICTYIQVDETMENPGNID